MSKKGLIIMLAVLLIIVIAAAIEANQFLEGGIISLFIIICVGLLCIEPIGG